MFRNIHLPLVACLTIAVLLCIHELGHVAADCVTGGRVTEFAILSLTPHVGVTGRAGVSAESVRAVGGSVAVLVAFALLMAVPRPSGFLEVVQDVSFWFALIEVLGWILSAMAPNIAGANDAREFLAISGLGRATVALAAALAGVCVVELRRRIKT